ncbi:hypothetical protein ACIG3E_11305 [Streptomyces sp. NPDC053474]|uniref:hypothetical protein n=1 Tax=Streptomyces sp. NPDC053474 TaxID=3365704 RepID=UPI0037D7E997
MTAPKPALAPVTRTEDATLLGLCPGAGLGRRARRPGGFGDLLADLDARLTAA